MRRNSKQARERELADNARLLRAWRAFHREERHAVLAGPHAATLVELFRAFANIECVKPAQLIGLVGLIDWAKIDANTRLVTLHEVNTAIVRYREKRGLEPIDDPLDDRPNTFQVIRKILNQFPAPSQARPMRRGPDPGANDEQ